MGCKSLCIESIQKLLYASEGFIHDECDCHETRELFRENVSKDKEKEDFFIDELKEIRKGLKKDLAFFMESDPAADNEEEVIYTYPGYRAVTDYRIAHLLYMMGFKFAARAVSEHAHFLTGIDIHPGALIGCPFFIDHGTGIVIGETAVVGNRVKLYQGVTLGALSLSDGYKLKGVKRHPSIGNNVTIYSNATILGGDVEIGDNVVVGANVFITESIPANTKVLLQKPELIVIKK